MSSDQEDFIRNYPDYYDYEEPEFITDESELEVLIKPGDTIAWSNPPTWWNGCFAVVADVEARGVYLNSWKNLVPYEEIRLVSNLSFSPKL